MDRTEGVSKGVLDRMVGPAAVYIGMSVVYFAALILYLHSPRIGAVPDYIVLEWTAISLLMLGLGLFALVVLIIFYRRLKPVMP